MILIRLLILALTPLAVAAETGTEPLPTEQIVVTAGFRDQDLMTSAGSTTVLSETDIEQRAARHLEDVILAVPNVSFTAAGSRARFV